MLRVGGVGLNRETRVEMECLHCPSICWTRLAPLNGILYRSCVRDRWPEQARRFFDFIRCFIFTTIEVLFGVRDGELRTDG